VLEGVHGTFPHFDVNPQLELYIYIYIYIYIFRKLYTISQVIKFKKITKQTAHELSSLDRNNELN